MISKIKAERNRQISLGYTREHDRRMGVGHLLYWAGVYFLRGKFVKSAALVVAAWEAQK